MRAGPGVQATDYCKPTSNPQLDGEKRRIAEYSRLAVPGSATTAAHRSLVRDAVEPLRLRAKLPCKQAGSERSCRSRPARHSACPPSPGSHRVGGRGGGGREFLAGTGFLPLW